MALSGYLPHYYTDPTILQLPACPNLKLIMNETNDQLINYFMNHLFHIRSEHLKVGKKLRPLIENTFATILMYHTKLVSKFGLSNSSDRYKM
jgi:hypothetical protein